MARCVSHSRSCSSINDDGTTTPVREGLCQKFPPVAPPPLLPGVEEEEGDGGMQSQLPLSYLLMSRSRHRYPSYHTRQPIASHRPGPPPAVMAQGVGGGGR